MADVPNWLTLCKRQIRLDFGLSCTTALGRRPQSFRWGGGGGRNGQNANQFNWVDRRLQHGDYCDEGEVWDDGTTIMIR